MQGFAAARLPLAFQPGTDFRYGFSIDVLGYIIQLVAGQPFDEFLQERIFSPLGMPDTTFWVPPEKMPHLAAVYQPDCDGRLKAFEPFGIRPYHAALPQTFWWWWAGLHDRRLFPLRPDAVEQRRA